MDDYRNLPIIKVCADLFPPHRCPSPIKFKIRLECAWECFDQSCVNRTETVHGTLRFLNLSHLLYGIICVNIFIMKSVYFKELHNEQEYYSPTIYRAGAAVVSTITSDICFMDIWVTVAKKWRHHVFYSPLYFSVTGLSLANRLRELVPPLTA